MQLSIQTKLFISFTLLCTILVLTSSYLYYSEASKTLIEKMEENNDKQLYYYQNAIDNLVQDLDRISAQVIYSSAIKNYLLYRTNEPDSSYHTFSERKKYEDMLANFNGPWFIAKQINLIGTDGFFLTYGQHMDIPGNIKQRISETTWLYDVITLEGDKHLIPPRTSEWQNTSQKEQLYFSLARSFKLPNSFTPALVEIQQSYDLLAKVIEKDQNQQQQVYVVNDQGDFFYPAQLHDRQKPVIPQWEAGLKEVQTAEQTELWSKNRSEFTGLTVYIKQSKALALLPVSQLENLILKLALLGEAVSLIISYFLAHTLTSPIRYLHKRITNMEVGSILPQASRKLQSTKEISNLYVAFEDMTKRLNQSIQETLEAHQRESVAHLHAMYAQMNPHFLFNTLSSMASYAEESGFKEYAVLSRNLSNMLRYSTNFQTQDISLKSELNYTLQYIELMKFRYEDQFTFNLYFDSHLEDIIVPKFLLQPLVENSFTHGFQHSRPPWIIDMSITSLEDEPYWMITIRDNGSGFDEHSYKETQALIQELNQGKTRRLQDISSKGLGKLGIVNTLTRCRLFWNENVTFYVQNLDRGMEFTLKIRKEH